MGVITLLTDYGAQDYYAALLKGALLRFVPEATLVDISHRIKRHDIMEAAFFIRSTYAHFPKNTLHIVAVNSFYDTENRYIFFEREGYRFLGPNNGVFSIVFSDLQEDEVRQIDFPIDVHNQYELLARGAADLMNLTEPLQDKGRVLMNINRKLALQPVITSQQIRATIIHVDQFGNIIINLDEKAFEEIRNGRDYAIYYKSHEPIERLSHAYNDCPVGDVCAFFNTIGLLEIAVNMGNAHELLNLNKNETIQINFY